MYGTRNCMHSLTCKTALSLILPLLGELACTSARAAPCSQLEAYAAETVVDYLDSWRNVHRAFEQFSHCDDGAISEGYSEAVARLMVDQWQQFPDLLAFTKREPAFAQFVLRHIDETLDPDDLASIKRLATTDCSPGAEALCEHITDAASKK